MSDQQVDVAFLTCATLLVQAVHTNARQELTWVLFNKQTLHVNVTSPNRIWGYGAAKAAAKNSMDDWISLIQRGKHPHTDESVWNWKLSFSLPCLDPRGTCRCCFAGLITNTTASSCMCRTESWSNASQPSWCNGYTVHTTQVLLVLQDIYATQLKSHTRSAVTAAHNDFGKKSNGFEVSYKLTLK